MTDKHHLPRSVDMSMIEGRLQAERAELAVRLHEVEQALARIAGGTYGICAECGRMIDPKRLSAFPAARQCLDCLQGFERRRGIVRNPVS